MKIYVASSWRNAYQPGIVALLQRADHTVYDFRNPPSGGNGFAWHEIDGGYESWLPGQYRNALSHPLAKEGFRQDLAGMEWADACLLVLPAGRSASWELGWFVGQAKATAIFVPEPMEPELMYGKGGLTPILITIDEIVVWARKLRDLQSNC